MSQSEIARQSGLDRKTVRKYLRQPPQGHRPRPARATKLDSYRSYLRERWEQGVHNARKLLGEVQKRGYAGRYTQVRKAVAVWREEESMPLDWALYLPQAWIEDRKHCRKAGVPENTPFRTKGELALELIDRLLG